MKRTGSPGDTGQTLRHLYHPPNPIFPQRLCPAALHASIRPFLPFTGGRLQTQPARIWSVALGVCGPRLLNKGADWLIDRPSAVPRTSRFLVRCLIYESFVGLACVSVG